MNRTALRRAHIEYHELVKRSAGGVAQTTRRLASTYMEVST